MSDLTKARLEALAASVETRAACLRQDGEYRTLADLLDEAAATLRQLAAAMPGEADRETVAGVSREKLLEAICVASVAKMKEFRLTNMTDKDGGEYPLIDALTYPEHGVDEGEKQIELIADDFCDAVADAILSLFPPVASAPAQVPADVQPVAWLYRCGHCLADVYAVRRPLNPCDEAMGWTETPLYDAAALASKQVQRLQAKLDQIATVIRDNDPAASDQRLVVKFIASILGASN